eukprot:TRINITY_DN55152_c0_g1_i1.p1 TRINITY_DN55152_c0_g1~~TRINITY_DN55152_c0_g1_i1.p1  ORF type:complete len:371 (+),score=71.85 TRINITY_DN55152_c0_g1_i1:60-1115(+)
MALFLDVDGVVVPIPSMGMGGGDFDYDCLKRLAEIYRLCPDLAIVLTSTWRLPQNAANRERLNQALAEVGIPPVTLSTPVNAKTQSNVSYLEDDLVEQRLVRDRVDEIVEWADENLSGPSRHKWIVLDDMDLGADPRMQGHFVLVDREWGLTSSEVTVASDLLQSLSTPAESEPQQESAAPTAPAPAPASAASEAAEPDYAPDFDEYEEVEEAKKPEPSDGSNSSDTDTDSEAGQGAVVVELPAKPLWLHELEISAEVTQWVHSVRQVVTDQRAAVSESTLELLPRPPQSLEKAIGELEPGRGRLLSILQVLHDLLEYATESNTIALARARELRTLSESRKRGQDEPHETT